MNKLFKLLADSKISLTGQVHNDEIIGIFTDISDSTLCCSVRVSPEDNYTIEEFTRMFAIPAVISIKRVRQRVKIESVREQAQEIQAACKSDEDLAVYEKIMGNVLDEIGRWCSIPEKA